MFNENQGLADGGRQLHEEKLEEFRAMTTKELKARLRLETRKAKIQEKLRGGEGATTSETNWNIIVLLNYWRNKLNDTCRLAIAKMRSLVKETTEIYQTFHKLNLLPEKLSGKYSTKFL